MSLPHLPAELLDHVVDLLQDEGDALENCCLVSKSWIPRSRRHLFNRMRLFLGAATLQSWRTTFPDPSTSPARYTRSLYVEYPRVKTVDVGVGGWIPTFSRVVHFELMIRSPRQEADEPEISLIPFHGFSPELKSLCVAAANFPPLPISNLIHSFSRLQDLAVITVSSFGLSNSPYTQLATTQSPSPLIFTGVLKLSLHMGMNPIAFRLLSIPNTLHFRELHLTWQREEDIASTTTLVERCSPTLENLKIVSNLVGEPQGPIDLSRAVKLQEVVFVFRWRPKWATTILRTLTSSHTNLRQISLRTYNMLHVPVFSCANPVIFRRMIGEAAYQEWLELDRLLTHLWESHSYQSKVLYDVPTWVNGQSARSCIESLFPEVTTRGIVDFVDLGHGMVQE